jgi:hypothetical protein
MTTVDDSDGRRRCGEAATTVDGGGRAAVSRRRRSWAGWSTAGLGGRAGGARGVGGRAGRRLPAVWCGHGARAAQRRGWRGCLVEIEERGSPASVISNNSRRLGGAADGSYLIAIG